MDENDIDTASNKETQESDTTRKRSDGSFGPSTIPPSLYYCLIHGDVLAQEVWWDEKQQPHCPHPRCNKLLTRKPSATTTTR